LLLVCCAVAAVASARRASSAHTDVSDLAQLAGYEAFENNERKTSRQGSSHSKGKGRGKGKGKGHGHLAQERSFAEVGETRCGSGLKCATAEGGQECYRDADCCADLRCASSTQGTEPNCYSTCCYTAGSLVWNPSFCCDGTTSYDISCGLWLCVYDNC